MSSGIAGAIAAVSVVMGMATDKLPFVQKEAYARDQVAVHLQVAAATDGLQDVKTVVASIQRTGLLNLQLSLQTRVEALSSTLKTIPSNSQNYYEVQRTRDEIQQQLDSVKAQLNR